MFSWIILAAQAVLAAAGLYVLRRRVLPNVAIVRQPQIVIDVWLPVAIALPFVVAAMRIGADVKGEGWVAIGGPIVCAIIGAGFALIAAGGRFEPFGRHALLHEEESAETLWPMRGRVIAAAMLAGIVLLMLGAAHVLTIWIGQACFALAAILLWINTPDAEPVKRTSDSATLAAGWGMLVVLLLAVAHAVVSHLVEPRHFGLSAIIMLAHAAIAIGMCAFIIAPGIAARLGFWVAAMGLFASLGLLSLGHVLPRAIGAITTGGDIEPAPQQIAFGFGAYAFEATALLILAPAMFALARTTAPAQRLLGSVVLIAVAALIFIRLRALI